MHVFFVVVVVVDFCFSVFVCLFCFVLFFFSISISSIMTKIALLIVSSQSARSVISKTSSEIPNVRNAL